MESYFLPPPWNDHISHLGWILGNTPFVGLYALGLWGLYKRQALKTPLYFVGGSAFLGALIGCLFVGAAFASSANPPSGNPFFMPLFSLVIMHMLTTMSFGLIFIGLLPPGLSLFLAQIKAPAPYSRVLFSIATLGNAFLITVLVIIGTLLAHAT